MTKQKNKQAKLKKRVIKNVMGVTARKGFGRNYFLKEKQ